MQTGTRSGVNWKVGRLASVAGFGLYLFCILFVGVKTSLVHSWTSPSDAVIYSGYGVGGAVYTLVLLPDRKGYVVVTDTTLGAMEVALTELRGTYGTHFFWRLWMIEGPNDGATVYGYRVYPKGTEPVVMEVTILDKFITGFRESQMPPIGDHSYKVMLFSNDAVRFEDVWLARQPADPDFVSVLERTLGVH